MAVPRAQTIVRQIAGPAGAERFCVLHESPLETANAFRLGVISSPSILARRIAFQTDPTATPCAIHICVVVGSVIVVDDTGTA